ncbi:MAG: hypothetical protein LC115_10855 [Bacteroidia bacterium]|nr:hypothetical protein [Bacteroidia bacterium]
MKNLISSTLRESIELIVQTELPEGFLVDILLSRGPQSLLEILVDTEQGVCLEDCVRISRALNPILEQDLTLDFPYNLIVSSPGLDRPLSHERQFKRYTDKLVEVKYIDGNKNTGILRKMTPESYYISLTPPKSNKKNINPIDTVIPKEQVSGIYPGISFKENYDRKTND